MSASLPPYTDEERAAVVALYAVGLEDRHEPATRTTPERIVHPWPGKEIATVIARLNATVECNTARRFAGKSGMT